MVTTSIFLTEMERGFISVVKLAGTKLKGFVPVRLALYGLGAGAAFVHL